MLLVFVMHRSGAKSHPQDELLKLQKENLYKQEAEENSRFVHKLGLYKLQCCLLMNGLVHESNEVLIRYPT
jgi:UDP-glucose:glycoprotein glucosyltransferase